MPNKPVAKFFDHRGNPMKFWLHVDSNGRELKRQIEEGGGELARAPKDATYVIVTKTATNYVRYYLNQQKISENSYIVLDQGWIAASVKRHAPIFHDDFGGFRLCKPRPSSKIRTNSLSRIIAIEDDDSSDERTPAEQSVQSSSDSEASSSSSNNLSHNIPAVGKRSPPSRMSPYVSIPTPKKRQTTRSLIVAGHTARSDRYERDIYCSGQGIPFPEELSLRLHDFIRKNYEGKLPDKPAQYRAFKDFAKSVGRTPGALARHTTRETYRDRVKNSLE